MTAPREDIEALCKRGEQCISDLCNGARWRMRVPADETDADMIFHSIINALREREAELEKARAALERTEAHYADMLSQAAVAYSHQLAPLLALAGEARTVAVAPSLSPEAHSLLCRLAAPAPTKGQADARAGTCQWQWADWPASRPDYETGCGTEWNFHHGELLVDDVRYCPSCGGRVLPPTPAANEEDADA